MQTRTTPPPELSFLKWLIGVISLAVGIYVATLVPGTGRETLIGGVVAGVLAGWLVLNCLPRRVLMSVMPWTEQEAKAFSLVVVILLAVIQRFHPDWLSGDWLGWISPVFPFILIVALLASLLRIIDIW